MAAIIHSRIWHSPCNMAPVIQKTADIQNQPIIQMCIRDSRFADYPINKMIYVVGNEQNYHFQVLSILLDKLGFEWGQSLVPVSYTHLDVYQRQL